MKNTLSRSIDSKNIQPFTIRIVFLIFVNIAPNLSSKCRPFIQQYSSHPFLDVYGVECNKGLAFDSVLSHLEEKGERRLNVVYLGDSENDNPAFRKADISILTISLVATMAVLRRIVKDRRIVKVLKRH